MEKRDRLRECWRRLEQLPSARSFEEARKQLSESLRGVEDEFSGVPDDENHPDADLRMFPPHDDYRDEVPGRPDLVLFRHRRHDTIFSEQGSVLVRDRKTGATLFEKANWNGERVQLP